MQIRQLQIARDSIQDRLTLRISSQANEEFRVFFTRRFLRELWPHLSAMLAGHLAAAPATSGASSPAVEPASFDKPFIDNNPTYPLGTMPLLASEATLTADAPGKALLIFREGRERSLNLHLNHELMQALCAMLRAAAEQSQWDLHLDYGKPAASKSEPPVFEPAKPSLLH